MCIRDSDVTVMLWQTVIYFVNKLSLSYHFLKAITGCLLSSSSSRMLRQRTAHRTGCGPAVQILSQKTSGLQFRRIQTQWTITCGVQCWRLTTSLKQSQKQLPNSRKRFRLSGAAYHKNQSTRLWKTSRIKRLKACVGAWSCCGHFEQYSDNGILEFDH